LRSEAASFLTVPRSSKPNKKPGAFRPRVMQFNRVVILQAESSEAAQSSPPAAMVIEIRVIRLIPKG
jgi:hypothetical protein